MASSESPLRTRCVQSHEAEFARLFEELSMPVDSRAINQGLAQLSSRLTSPSFRRSIGSTV